MRIDKYLNAVNITKRRAIAQDMLKEQIVYINGIQVKKAKDIKIGDIITIKYLEYEDNFKVLDIPTTKSTPRSLQEEYVCQIKE